MSRFLQAEAGPSNHVAYRHGSTASSSTQSSLPSPALSTHNETLTHVQAIHEFSPALLGSTSVAANPNMYLSFKNGEVIRVHARDSTGWWDGEIATAHNLVNGVEQSRNGPRRGWFPSNYVREMGHDAGLHRRGESGANSESTSESRVRSNHASISTVHSRHVSAASHMSRTSSANSEAYAPFPTQRNGVVLPPNLQALLRPVLEVLSLLDAAIHTDRKAHIQPAAAQVISAIRAVLLQTDCLNKNSDTLASFQPLSRERKIILAELSRLVASARQASGTMNDSGVDDRTPEEETRDFEVLANSARSVFASMKRFLKHCKEFNIEPVFVSEDARKIVIPGERMQPSHPASPPVSDRTNPDSASQGRIRTPSGGNARIQETFRMRAASISDLRAARKLASSPPPPVPHTAGLTMSREHSINSTHSPSNASTPLSATFGSTSSGRSSPDSIRSRHNRRILGSIDTTSSRAQSPVIETHSHPSHDQDTVKLPPTPTEDKQLSSSVDVLDAISLAEDSVLSIIAAFIGHVHSHHMGSHPSSHAILIEMTRETVDCVRELLTVVEAVGRDNGVRRAWPREVEHMRLSKDMLYDVTNRLVEGVELIAHAPFTETTEEDYDAVKSQILSTATATLRAGTECVRWVRLCVPEGSDSFAATTPTPRYSESLARQSTPRPPPRDATLVLREKVVGQRGSHTLSGLHRKASSLSLLHKKFRDGNIMESTAEDDSETAEEEEDEEFVADSSRDEDMTLQPVPQGLKPFPPGLQRPPLIQTNSSPFLGRPAPRSAEVLRTFSDDMAQGLRSRSSSLTSPMPSRIKHRSPSRSADLDKFTGDYDLPSVVQTHNKLRSSSYQGSPALSASNGVLSYRSSAGSDHTTPIPLTPHALDKPLQPQEESLVGYMKSEAPSTKTPFSKFGNLTIDTDVTPIGTQASTRPLEPTRSLTAPGPSINTDIRFWVVAHDYDPREITFNSDGTMVGASLTVLVEKMTPHDGPVEHTFWTTFFYTFRLFTTPADLVAALIARYDLTPPSSVQLGEKDRAIWIESKVVPVRLRIYNFLKAWLDTHWMSESDDMVLDTLRDFATDVMARTLPAMAPRLEQAIHRRKASPLSSSASSDAKSLRRISSFDHFGRSTPSTFLPPQHGGLPPTPIISKSLNQSLQRHPSTVSLAVTDFDSLELARQLTIMESKLFSLVMPEDLLQSGRGKKSIPELKALSTCSNQITGWVADNILNERDPKKRASLLKYYIKLADKCLTLNNFSTMFAVLAGLNSSFVQRLKKTWEVLPGKYRLIMDRLQTIIDHTKNHAAYRARLRDVEGPCLPFLGIILTDITFTVEGNADTRPSSLSPELQLINQDKYTKLGKIAIEFEKYQRPFNLHELEAVQTFLKRTLAERGSSSVDALYRKSLMLEPRVGTEKITSAVERPSWLSTKMWEGL